jgi:biopolymer transport protein ExbB
MDEDSNAAAAGDLGSASGADAALAPVLDLLDKGGIAIWAILAASIFALALILWKLWRLSAMGAWRREPAETAVALWQAGETERAAATARAGRGSCADLVAVAIACAGDASMARDEALAETTRVAKRHLGEAQAGLRGLEAVATIAPLLGLFGTVLGMISAFQALETAGAQADPAALAGGIWEALLTTAAGMGVAIPVSAALTWYESVIDRLRRDMEDMATRIFNRAAPAVRAEAAE